MGKGGARAALDIGCRVQGAVSAPPPSWPTIWDPTLPSRVRVQGGDSRDGAVERRVRSSRRSPVTRRYWTRRSSVLTLWLRPWGRQCRRDGRATALPLRVMGQEQIVGMSLVHVTPIPTLTRWPASPLSDGLVRALYKDVGVPVLLAGGGAGDRQELARGWREWSGGRRGSLHRGGRGVGSELLIENVHQ